MSFFSKALKSLEAIEPLVKMTSEQQYINYKFSGLEDDDDRDSVFLTDDEDDQDDSVDDFDALENGELSFDLRRNNQKNEVSSSGNSMELDYEDLTVSQIVPKDSRKASTCRKPLWESTTLHKDLDKYTKSAPLSAERTFDPSERFRQMHQSSARKLNTYVLPTPLEKSTVSPGSNNQGPQPRPTTNTWHSSPLEHKKYERLLRNDKYSGPMVSNAQSVLKKSNTNSKPTPIRELSSSTQLDPRSAFTAKKMKRYAISGPLTSNSQSNKPLLSASGPIGSTGYPPLFSRPLFHSPLTRPSSTPKLSSLSENFVSSPKISELHELPRPPAHIASKKPSKVGFSAPLVTYKHGLDLKATCDAVVSPPIFLKNS